MSVSEKELEKRTKQRLKKTFSIKQLKKDTKEKQRYLKYFKKTKKVGGKPLTWGQWRLVKEIGGSKQTRGGIASLSPGDAADIRKYFLKRR